MPYWWQEACSELRRMLLYFCIDRSDGLCCVCLGLTSFKVNSILGWKKRLWYRKSLVSTQSIKRRPESLRWTKRKKLNKKILVHSSCVVLSRFSFPEIIIPFLQRYVTLLEGILPPGRLYFPKKKRRFCFLADNVCSRWVDTDDISPGRKKSFHVDAIALGKMRVIFGLWFV